MRVVVFVVNYNADDHLARFVASVRSAASSAGSSAVQIHVLDNSQKSDGELEHLRVRLTGPDVAVSVHSTGRNEGYFGVLPLAQKLVPSEVDVVLYGNPDIVLDTKFMERLDAARESGGVLAPAIVSRDDGFDQNPKYLSRLPARKLRRLRAIYATRLTYGLFTAAARLKERVRRRGGKAPVTAAAREIYAPHGSLFVFADVRFFLDLPSYPCFLFGEELFVAEEAARRGVKVIYDPTLRVEDVRHASISLLERDDLRRYMHESVRWILARYYTGEGRGH